MFALDKHSVLLQNLIVLNKNSQMHLRRPLIDQNFDTLKKSSRNLGEWALPSSKIRSK